jgi:hypothetical protein
MQIRYIQEGGELLESIKENFNDNDDDNDTSKITLYVCVG